MLSEVPAEMVRDLKHFTDDGAPIETIREKLAEANEKLGSSLESVGNKLRFQEGLLPLSQGFLEQGLRFPCDMEISIFNSELVSTLFRSDAEGLCVPKKWTSANKKSELGSESQSLSTYTFLDSRK